MPETVYTSVVTGWGSAVTGTVCSTLAATVPLHVAGVSGARFSLALALVLVTCVAFAARLATVRIVVSGDGVRVGSGIHGRARQIPRERIAGGEVVRLSWPAVFGMGLPLSRLTTRLTVRAGSTIALRLTSGERLWISAADPEGAAALLAAFASPQHMESCTS